MSGFSAWLIQRLTAVYMVVFILVAIFWSATIEGLDYHQWRIGFYDIWVSLGVFLFGLSVLFHAWIGLRDVIVDYIHPLGFRVFALTLVGLYLLANGFWLLSVLAGAF